MPGRGRPGWNRSNTRSISGEGLIPTDIDVEDDDRPPSVRRGEDEALAQLSAEHCARLADVDPLLGATAIAVPVPRRTGADNFLELAGAVGLAEVKQIRPDSVESIYGKLTRFTLSIRWAGQASALDQLLDRWARWLRHCHPDAGGVESEASLAWPARDVEAGRVFRRHGLACGTTVAIRLPRRPTPVGHRAVLDGLTVRRASTDDVEAIATLGADEVRYEQGLTTLTVRDNHLDLARPGIVASLRVEPPWTWVATDAGQVVAALRLSRPADSTWMAGYSARSPVAYLALLSVDARYRGSGVGTALVTEAHAQVDDAGVGATLLHYGTANPLSVPFWSRMGYRPLWSYWETSPASTLR